MSLVHAIRNCRKPIGGGNGRRVYYSKKYDVIIKRPKYGFFCSGEEQNEYEAELCGKLTDEEKEIIPIISYVKLTKDDEIVIIWKRVEPLEEKLKTKHNELLEDLSYWWRRHEYKKNLKTIIEILSLDDNIEQMLGLVEKYNLDDVKPENLGIMNNHLVILDCGWYKRC